VSSTSPTRRRMVSHTTSVRRGHLSHLIRTNANPSAALALDSAGRARITLALLDDLGAVAS
jgi:hypothetical protein